MDKLHKLRDRAVAQAVKDRWLAEPVVAKRTAMRQTIEARLVELDEEEASLDRRARGAMRLVASEQPGVAVEAERALSEVNADRLALQATREGLQAQHGGCPRSARARPRSASSTGCCSTPRRSRSVSG